MKILIGNNTLSLLAGSETWSFTLASALKKLGHQVFCFSPELGIISEELLKENIVSFNRISTSGVKPFSFVLEEPVDHSYDVIIANHWHIVEHLRKEFPKTPIISTIHGIIHEEETPQGVSKAPEHPALEAGVNQFVAVSEEVQALLKKQYNIDSVIIRNFIDLKRFKGKRKVSKTPKQFLINSNYNGKNDPETELIRTVAKHYGAKLTALGQNFSQTFDTRKAVEDADIVVGMGRSVLEGVATGRLGIVHGRWGTAGVIREGNIQEIRQCNFSGRNSNGKFMSAEELISEIDKFYNTPTIEWGKSYVAREHNAALAADTFVQLARDLTGQNFTRPAEPPMKKYRRANEIKRTA